MTTQDFRHTEAMARDAFAFSEASGRQGNRFIRKLAFAAAVLVAGLLLLVSL